MKRFGCDTVFSGILQWLETHPKQLKPVWPPPNPNQVILDDILDHLCVLKSLSLPQNGFSRAISAKGFIGNYEQGMYWINIDEAFEQLVSLHHKAFKLVYDEDVMYQMTQGINQKFGPEALRINIHHNPRNERQYDSSDWTVLCSVSSIRTHVPNREVNAVMGWEMNVWGIYRPKEALVFFDPTTKECCYIGQELRIDTPFIQKVLTLTNPEVSLIDIPTHLNPPKDGKEDWVFSGF